jgi:hypothetical protein
MLGESVAIKVTANAQDWTWELIDDNGKTITCGVSGSQEAAMESAWRAVRLSADVALSDYPHIILGYN